MMRLSFPVLLAAALLAGPAFAQKSDAPLGDIVDAIPLSDAKTAPERQLQDKTTTPAPARSPAPGRVGAADLPPSKAMGRIGDGGAAEAAAPGDEATRAKGPANEADTPADAAWEARQEARRNEINAQEAPVVARLNQSVTAIHERNEREAEERQRQWEREVAELEEQARAAEAAHQADLEAHRAALAAREREAARRQADYERRVALCLSGRYEYCAKQN